MEKTSRPEIMRGHLDECFTHLKQRLNQQAHNSSHNHEMMSALAVFCGCSYSAVTRWQPGSGSMPLADARIKLMAYLDLLGYRVIELENMSTSFRALADLIAFGLIDPSQALIAIGYADIATLYKVIHGKSNASPEKKEKTGQLVKEKISEINPAKEKAYQKLPAFAAKLLPSSIEIKPKIKETGLIGTSVNNSIQGLLSIMQGLDTLLNSEAVKLTDQELALFPDFQKAIIARLAEKFKNLQMRLNPEKDHEADDHVPS